MNIRDYHDVLRALWSFVEGDETDERKALKRQRILDAASELFERHGYRLTSVSAVARRAAVAKGTVYLYYPSKAELLLHVIIRERARLYDRMEPVLAAEQPPRERLRHFLVQAALLQDEMPVSKRIKLGDRDFMTALAGLHHEVLWSAAKLFDEIIGWLVREAAPEALEPEEVHERGHVLIALLQVLPALTQPHLLGPMSREAFCQRFADTLVDGLTAPPAERGE